MAQIKDRHKVDNLINAYLHFDRALEAWFKKHLPIIHQVARWWADRLSKPDPRPARLSYVIVLLILFLVYWFGR